MSDLTLILEALPWWMIIGLLGFAIYVVHALYSSLFGKASQDPHLAVIEEIAQKLDGQARDLEKVGRGGVGVVQTPTLNATICIESWTEGHAKRRQPFCSAEVKVAMTTLPVWFVFDIRDGEWVMELGHDRITAVQDELLHGLMSDASRAALVMLVGTGHIDSEGGQMAVTMTQSLFSTRDLFVEHITDFVRALEDLEQCLPGTLQDVDDFVTQHTRDATLLLSVYHRALSQMDTDVRAQSLVREAIEHRASGALLITLLSKQFKTLEPMLQDVVWEPARHLEVLEAAFQHKHLNPSIRNKVGEKVFEAVSLDTFTQDLAKRFRGAIYPFLRHHWATPAMRTQVLHAVDALVRWMDGSDAVRWLNLFTRDAPHLCTYERFGAVLKHKMSPVERSKIVPALEAVLRAQPDALVNEQWFKRALGMLQFASAVEVQRITPLLVEHVESKHVATIREFMDNPKLQGHAMHDATSALMRVLQDRMPKAGSLSLSDANQQEGQLTSVVEQGALNTSEQGA